MADSWKISANVTGLVDDLVNKARLQKKAMEKSTKDSIFSVFKEVVQRTPIDSGYLQGNWRMRRGSPSGRSLPPKVRGVKYNREGSVLANGRKVINNWRFDKEELHIANDTDYAGVVEYVSGFSKYAPAGMLRVSLAKFDAKLSRFFTARKLR